MTNPEELAMPQPAPLSGTLVGGLTKREYFTAILMSGLPVDSSDNIKYLARLAIDMADALIVELNHCPQKGSSCKQNTK